MSLAPERIATFPTPSRRLLPWQWSGCNRCCRNGSEPLPGTGEQGRRKAAFFIGGDLPPDFGPRVMWEIKVITPLVVRTRQAGHSQVSYAVGSRCNVLSIAGSLISHQPYPGTNAGSGSCPETCH